MVEYTGPYTDHMNKISMKDRWIIGGVP